MHHRKPTQGRLGTLRLVAATLPMIAGSGRSLAQGLSTAMPSCGVAVAPVALLRNTSPPSGAIKPTMITLQPGQGQYLGISFFESRLDSACDQWRSAGWTAIASSSLLLGDSLNQHSFSFDAEGSIDGPSAEGLFTASTRARWPGLPTPSIRRRWPVSKVLKR